ncbi:hypothetical protein [Noviluteimonas gilva]|uniref:Uncharacterized protein n=1 Tax=Noviluteimonas gilva TaxID=2682097 RepID=A0A7C9LKB6_9GAMM|nr:hypothetical protein [Lysobacter gilvus]MUV13384.1 hypothetical protein [Lysobacter gilvus]
MKLHLTSLAISLLLPIAAAAAPRERAPVGSVHQVGDHQLQVCFKHTPRPDVGMSLAIQRGSIPFKSSGATLFKTIGHARVTATEASCVTAELVDGVAKRYDRVIMTDATAATEKGDCRCPC